MSTATVTTISNITYGATAITSFDGAFIRAVVSVDAVPIIIIITVLVYIIEHTEAISEVVPLTIVFNVVHPHVSAQRYTVKLLVDSRACY